jgi:hypothetical protein
VVEKAARVRVHAKQKPSLGVLGENRPEEKDALANVLEK